MTASSLFRKISFAFLLLISSLNASATSSDSADNAESTSSESLSENAETVRLFGDKPKSLEEWMELFKNREGNGRAGGIAVHRIIEADPVPLYSEDRYLPICFKYADELTGFKGTEAEKVNLKKSFWEEAAPLQYELMHPLCFKVLAECADVLEAKEISKMVHTAPFIVMSNIDFLSNIKDFSRFSPEHVKEAFDSPLRGRLNLAKMENVLRTLPAASLVKLLEMTMWDLSEWEMDSLLKARNGVEKLMKDCDNHVNLIPLLYRHMFMIPDLQRYTEILESPLEQLSKAIKSNKYGQDQLFIATVNLIFAQETLLAVNLSNLVNDFAVEASRINIRALLADKCKIQKLLKKKLKVLESLVGSPLNRLNHDSLEYLREIAGDDEFPYKSDLIMNADGTKKSLAKVMDEWKDLGKNVFDDSFLFSNGIIGRSFAGIIISRFPETSDEEIESIIHHFMDNRALFFYRDSMMMMRLAWPQSEIIQSLEQEFFTQPITQRNLNLMKEVLQPMIQEAITNFQIFNSTNGKFQSLQDNISSWVAFHMNLQNVANVLKQFDDAFVADIVLPFLLDDEMMKQVFEEFPNILVPEGVIKYLLENNKLELFKKYPRMLHGLGSYWEFKGEHFKALQNDLDFTKIRRALYTVSPIQLVSFLKSKDGLIDDPTSFIGSMSESKVWKVPSYVKYLAPYFRVPLMIEDPSFGSYIDVAYNSPVSLSVADPAAFIWSVIKWAISCEIYFQEFFLTDRGNLSGTKRLMDAWLITTESIYRPKIIEKLKSFEFAEGDDLKSIFTAVIKTLQVTPLSKDRRDQFTGLTGITLLFPSMSTKPATIDRSINNFRSLVTRFANTQNGESDTWTVFLDICNRKFDQDNVNRILANSQVPIYYKTLLMRRVLAEKRED